MMKLLLYMVPYLDEYWFVLSNWNLCYQLLPYLPRLSFWGAGFEVRHTPDMRLAFSLATT